MSALGLYTEVDKKSDLRGDHGSVCVCVCVCACVMDDVSALA